MSFHFYFSGSSILFPYTTQRVKISTAYLLSIHYQITEHVTQKQHKIEKKNIFNGDVKNE